MSLAHYEITPATSADEREPEEATAVNGLPSPLAEIALQAKLDSGGRTAASKPGRSRPRRSSSRKRSALPTGAVLLGTLVGLNDAGEPLVVHPLDPSGRPLRARSMVPLDATQVEREVVVAFESGDSKKPIILGLLWRPVGASALSPAPRPDADRPPVEAEVDGDRLVFAAKNEIVLRCGEASITLTRAGKVLIRGSFLLSRSSGVNRIKGGSVQIN